MPLKVIPLPVAPQKDKKKPRNMTSDGRRCVRVDAGTDPETGRRVRKAFYGHTLKEAQAKADAFKRAMADGFDMAAREQPVSQWAEQWLRVYGSKGAPGTILARETRVRRLVASLGHLRLCDVRQIHVQQYADSLLSLSAGTVRNYRNIAQAVFRAAVQNRIIAFDPTLGVSWGGTRSGTHRALSREEIAAISAHWYEHPMGAPVILMLYAGLRRGEALGLRWQDVDLAAGVLHIRHALRVGMDHNSLEMAAPKTLSSERDVAILPIVRTVLVQLPHDSEYLFPTYRTASAFMYAFSSFVEHMRRYLGPAFVLRAHDLRHTFASMCYDANVDVKTAQALLGHATPQITMQVYTHLSAEKKAASVHALADYTNSVYGHQMGINWPEIPDGN
ncbi:MAG: site-specific integrase [Clostridia bacterium]|nr:site-specific integrase [Clostridia bacterium]